jgi:hypothetical protein
MLVSMSIILVGGGGIPGDGEAHDEEYDGVRDAGGRVVGQREQQDGAKRERRRGADLRQRDPAGVGEPPGDGVPDDAAEERAEGRGEEVEPRDDAGLPVREADELQPHGGEVERGPGDGPRDALRHDDLERGHPEDAPGVPEQLLRFLRGRRRGLGLGARVGSEDPHERAQRDADDRHGVEGEPPPGDAEEGDGREQHTEGSAQDGAQVAGHLEPAEGGAARVVVGVVGDEGADRREDQREADAVEAPRDGHLAKSKPQATPLPSQNASREALYSHWQVGHKAPRGPRVRNADKYLLYPLVF